ncbi:Hypothetical predicted protein [Podarcis lilfordi]|uniref:Uncharacterized protein n=1 Tax=Podarcis lilfordi TaxID=74358 RepID=A0AA35QQ90_9SAUR|nr:Hypothetical predicted protein [Podarcis lilfordi]
MLQGRKGESRARTKSQRTHFQDRQCLWLEALHTRCAYTGQRLPVLAQDSLSSHSEEGDGEERQNSG